MSPFLRHKLLKLAKIIASTIAIVICGFFLLIFSATYLFISSMDSQVSYEKINTPDQLLPKQGGSEVLSQSKQVDPVQTYSSEKMSDRDKRVKQRLFIKEIVSLREDPRLQSAPPICEILCAPSTWQKPIDGEEVWDRFNLYLEQEGSRAFDDPKFRLAYDLVNAHADIMTVLGEALEKIEPLENRKNEWSEAEKVYWSANAPILILNVGIKIKELIPKSQKQSKIVQMLIKLNKQCEERSKTEIEESCRSISEDLMY